MGIAVSLLGIAAVFQVFDGAQVAIAGSLRGLKDTRVPMIINVVSYWIIGLGTGLLIGFVLDGGAVGLWWGLVVGLGVAAILLVIRFRLISLRPNAFVITGENGTSAKDSKTQIDLSLE